MSSRLRAIGVASLLAFLAFALYLVPRNTSPLTSDERAILQQAATVTGGPTRLFFYVADEQWLQPIPVYATALASVVTPANQAGRVAAAVVGALDVALMFLLARRLFSQPLVPVVTALLLMVTPAHFVHARSGTDAIYLLPFVLVWLINLVAYLRDGREWRAAVAASALGLGVYTQPAGPVTMAFLLAVMLTAIFISRRGSLRAFAIPVAAFSLPLALAAVWFAANPQAYPDTFGRWAIHAAHLRYPLDGVRAFLNWTTLGNRVSLYWGFFDPSWLFLDGPDLPPTTLRGGAPFLLVTLAMLVVGVRCSLNHRSSAVATVLVGGLAISPLVASTFGQPHAIESAMAAVPFVVILAAGGLVGLWSSERRRWRAVAWAALAACVIDFGWFYAAYWR